MANHGLFFGLFSIFSNTNITGKIVGIIGIRTRIVWVESEHADPLTTTTAQINVLVTSISIESWLLFKQQVEDASLSETKDRPLICSKHIDHTNLERECALWPFWQKKWQLQQARLFYKMAWICFYF